MSTALEHGREFRSLIALVEDAKALAAPDETAFGGRMWRSIGGRSCPIGWHHCSQAVFEDVRTGEVDYGARGGPGHAECQRTCPEGMHPAPEPEDDEPTPEAAQEVAP